MCNNQTNHTNFHYEARIRNQREYYIDRELMIQYVNELEGIKEQVIPKFNIELIENLPDNALLKVRPELYYEWDFIKNYELGLDIYKVTKGSGKKVWWVCNDCGSSYQAILYNKIKGYKCSCCASKIINHTNSLASLRPDLASEWQVTKNNVISAYCIALNYTKKVWWICPDCGSDYDATPNTRNISSCPYCASQKVNHTNSLASLNPELAKQWHPTFNGDLTPHDVLPNSNKKHWWFCNKGHEWDAPVSDRNIGNNCPYCSGYKAWRGETDLWTTHHHIAELLLNPEDGYKYSFGSNARVDWNCKCGNIVENKVINKVVSRGIKCPKCSDGVKYPEKFMYCLLKDLDIDFIKELSSKHFEWIVGKRYDFYIPSLKCIIETHGEQHYFKDFSDTGGRTLKEEQENDEYKYELAIVNGIEPENYIVIDCRKSEFEFIKNNIMNSRLSELFDLSNVDWDKIKLDAENSLYLEVVELWNANTYKTPKELANHMKLNDSLIRIYLKKGTTNGHCNYSEKQSKINNRDSLKKPVVQLSLDGKFIAYFESASDANKINEKLRASGICGCCRGEINTSCGYKWMYKEDYETA